jgi:hypothetical protein
LGRWAIFFVAMFGFCTFLFSIPAGGGQIAQTTLTAVGGISATATVSIAVTDTSDFLSAGTFVIDNEEIAYTGKDPTDFLGLTRGVQDPQITSLQNPASVHAQYSAVKSLPIQAIDSMLDLNITSSTAGFGTVQALYMAGRFFANFPKFLLWDYPMLNSGQLVFLKIFLFYPISAGFVFAIFYGFIVLAMGLFHT